MAHTKGVWKSKGVARQDSRDPVFYHTDVICNETIRVARSSGMGEEFALANAQLIAAAPDLLRALQSATDYMGGIDHPQDVLQLAREIIWTGRAAISRALGEPEQTGDSDE